MTQSLTLSHLEGLVKYDYSSESSIPKENDSPPDVSSIHIRDGIERIYE